MVWIRRARAAAGFLAVITLLGLFVADFLLDPSLDTATVSILLVLIGALLGLDKLGETLPLQLTIERDGEGDAAETTDEDENV